MLTGYLHDLAFRVLWRYGYELKRMDKEGWSPENLRKPGFAPGTLIDVGVGTGTPGLHEAFPDAHHVFLEPLQEFESSLRDLVARFGGEYHLVAVGDGNREDIMHVDKRIPMQSSLSLRAQSVARPMENRSVSVVRLDALAAKCNWRPPFGLKIDTEGYERQVIDGATDVLAQTQFVIAEIGVSERFDAGNSFAGLIRMMDDRGFRLCDILSNPRSRDGELIQLDAMFRRTRSGISVTDSPA